MLPPLLTRGLLQFLRLNSLEFAGKYLFRKPTDDLWKALQVFGGLIGNNSVAQEKFFGGFAVDAAIEIIVLSDHGSFEGSTDKGTFAH